MTKILGRYLFQIHMPIVPRKPLKAFINPIKYLNCETTIAFLLIISLNSCKSDVTTYIPFIEGYWEIVSVTKDQKKVKEFKMSGSIDYFKVNEDLSGYRKKVTPRFDGAFEMSQHQSEFNLSIMRVNCGFNMTTTLFHTEKKLLERMNLV